jgi:hypothetical protein
MPIKVPTGKPSKSSKEITIDAMRAQGLDWRAPLAVMWWAKKTMPKTMAGKAMDAVLASGSLTTRKTTIARMNA